MTTKKDKFYFTSAKLAKLKSEYQQLVDVKRPHTIERISEARKEGDLAENSEYHHAREELVFISNRMEELKNIISRAVLISNNKNGCQKIELGCQTVLETKDGREYQFMVVGEMEADPAVQKISLDSPLGMALAGKKVGDQVFIQVPAGKLTYTVKKIN